MIEIDIRFEVDGEEVVVEEFGASIERVAFQGIKEQIGGIV